MAATYLADVKLPSIWYQIDSTDSDPAAFFYFLALALGNSGATLPWLAAELAEDLPRFARIFFRDFYKRLPDNTVVVFDNCQDLDWSTHGELMEIAFSEIPEGVNVLALSRDPPPVRLAHLELSGRIATLSREALRMSSAEARALGQLGQASAEANDDMEWLNQADGWAAGIVMLRSHLAKTPEQKSIPRLEGREAICRYFAGVILERMPEPAQKQLLMLSCLSSISEPDAVLLTGNEDAGRLLKQLYRDGLFVDCRGTKTPIYYFHSLFQEFLKEEATRRLDAGTRLAQLRRAAVMIDGQGRTEEAARLYRDAHAFDLLASLLIRVAKPMKSSGRGLSWCEWLGWLPPEMVGAYPWLRYWHGVFQNPVNSVLAKETLLSAHRAFCELSDVRGQALTIAAIVDNYLAYYGSGDFQNLDEWIVALREAMRQIDPGELSTEEDLVINSRLVAALFHSSPDSLELQSSVKRVMDLMPQVTDHAEQLTAGGVLLFCMHWIDADVVSRIAGMVRSYVKESAISPTTRVWCCIRAARWYFDLNGDLQSARQLTDFALKLAIDFAPSQVIFHLRYMDCLLLLAANDLTAAQTAMQQLRETLPGAAKIDLLRFTCLELSYSLQRGDNDQCMQAMKNLLERSTECATSPAEHSRHGRTVANCHAQMGNFAAAYVWLEKAIAHAHGADQELAIQNRAFIQAYQHITEGDEAQGRVLLTSAFKNHRQQKNRGFFVRFPVLAGTLAALALDAGIDVAYVRDIIQRQGLAAPKRFSANWPRPVEVRIFGKMELLFDGTAAPSKGKSQQRLHKLLKMLLISGEAGRSQTALIANFWPEAEGARSALSVAVHRLRKLLKTDEAILVSGGRVCVNTKIISSDLFGFDALCRQVDGLPASPSENSVVKLAGDLLAIYRGPLCDGDEEAWFLPARERTQQRFLALATALGTQLEQLAQWNQARDLYLRALSIEPLSEVVYRALMRCAHAQNDPSAAFSAYRRCRDSLSILLGKKPSEETEKLAVALGLFHAR